jgi:hypothetical protein
MMTRLDSSSYTSLIRQTTAESFSETMDGPRPPGSLAPDVAVA